MEKTVEKEIEEAADEEGIDKAIGKIKAGAEKIREAFNKKMISQMKFTKFNIAVQKKKMEDTIKSRINEATVKGNFLKFRNRFRFNFKKLGENISKAITDVREDVAESEKVVKETKEKVVIVTKEIQTKL